MNLIDMLAWNKSLVIPSLNSTDFGDTIQTSCLKAADQHPARPLGDIHLAKNSGRRHPRFARD